MVGIWGPEHGLCRQFLDIRADVDPPVRLVDSFHTARHVRMRDSAYCGRSNQSERLHAAQSSQSYPDQLTVSLFDRTPTLQGLEDQNCNRSEA